ncbi:MAG: Holliday junction resolvase-like protein [candidate division WOR-3 bacterium]
MSRLLDIFQDFQKVLIICPICGEIHRLSELKLFYRGKVKRTWLDIIREKEKRIERAEELLEENWDKIKAKAQEKGRKQIPKLLRKCVPVICAHGYYPQDLKTLFDPVDFIIFDGMNLKDKVRKVVLFDGPPHDKRREKIQTSLKKVIKKGNYDWYTVKLD